MPTNRKYLWKVCLNFVGFLSCFASKMNMSAVFSHVMARFKPSFSKDQNELRGLGLLWASFGVQDQAKSSKWLLSQPGSKYIA